MSSDGNVWIIEYQGREHYTRAYGAWVAVPEGWFHITRDKTGPCVPLSLEECVKRVQSKQKYLEKSSLNYRLRNCLTNETIPYEIL